MGTIDTLYRHIIGFKMCIQECLRRMKGHIEATIKEFP